MLLIPKKDLKVLPPYYPDDNEVLYIRKVFPVYFSLNSSHDSWLQVDNRYIIINLVNVIFNLLVASLYFWDNLLL